MEIFNFILPVYVWILLAVAAIAAVIVWRTAFSPMKAIARDTSDPELPPDAPKVSVIALAEPESDPSEFIKSVTVQQYPDFELIIVHEATTRANAAFAEQFAWQPPASDDDSPAYGCRRVRFCFYPPGSRAVSRKKLALSIGIKAADGDVILTTTTDSEIPSDLWIAGMIRHFTPSVDFVLGYARYDFDELPEARRPLTRFHHIMTSGQWIAAALADIPSRGDGANLAYRREMFFSSKGFAGTNDLVNGEDDIFVAANHRPGNTRVELADCSTVTHRSGGNMARMLRDAREHYRFTARRIDRRPFRMQGIASASQWVMMLTLIVGAVISLPNLFPAAIALLIFIAAYLSQALAYRPLARTLGDSRKWLLAPVFLLLRPIDNLILDIAGRNHRFKNYTIRRQ